MSLKLFVVSQVFFAGGLAFAVVKERPHAIASFLIALSILAAV